MTRVVLVGYDPETVDYSNPALPPGMTVEKIRAGVDVALKQMTDRGWESDVCYIRPDGTAGQMVERHLASANYACVVIGAGVRLPLQSLADFEAVVNAAHKAAPAAAIAFNTRPETVLMLPGDGCLPVESANIAGDTKPVDNRSQEVIVGAAMKIWLGALTLSVCIVGTTAAQSGYPNRPITLVVTSAGSRQ